MTAWTSWQLGHVIRSGREDFYAYGVDGWYCLSHRGCESLTDEPRVSAIVGLPDRTPSTYTECRRLLTEAVADLIRRGAVGTSTLTAAEAFLDRTGGSGE